MGYPNRPFLREGRDDVGDHAERREDEDVDLRVPEHPEQVLPEDGIGPGRRVEEVRPEPPVEQHEDEADRERREGEQDEGGDDQRHPGEQRHPHERHPGRPQVEDRNQEIHPARDGPDTRDQEREKIEVHPQAGRILGVRQRHVGEPAAVRHGTERHTGVEEQAAEEEDPEGQGVQPGERHVARPDLERHDEVEKRRDESHAGEEDHRRAVHGEQLVVQVGIQKIAPGRGPAGAAASAPRSRQ